MATESIGNNEIESLLAQRIGDEGLRTSLACIKQAMNDVWSPSRPRIVPVFTSHGSDHCMRVFAWCNRLFERVQPPLTEEEMYVLLAGVYLHDVGMQCDVASQQRVVKAAKAFGGKFNVRFTAKSAGKYSDKQQDAIRRNHHYLTAALIDDARKTRKGILGQAISTIPSDVVGDVRDVCMYHSGLSIRDCPESFMHCDSHRKRLVAAILRFADELDIEKHRASSRIIQDVQLDPDNEVYWWLHGRTRIEFFNTGTLKIRVLLSQEDYAEHGRLVAEQVVTRFRTKNAEVLDVLSEHNCGIHIHGQSGSEINPYEEDLPQEIVDALYASAAGKSEASQGSSPRQAGTPDYARSSKTEVGNLLVSLAQRLSGEKQTEASELIRFHSIAAAQLYNARTGNVLGNHEANLLYRHAVELSFPEQYLVLRGMLADASNCVPGWRFVSAAHPEELYSAACYAAVNDPGTSVRLGALRFVSKWECAGRVNLFREVLVSDASPGVRALVAELLSMSGEQQDTALLEDRLREGKLSQEVVSKCTCILVARSDPARAIRSLDASCDSFAGDVVAVIDLRLMPDDVLVSGIDGNCKPVRLACAQELLRREARLDKLVQLQRDKDVSMAEVGMFAWIVLEPDLSYDELKARLDEVQPSGAAGSSLRSLLFTQPRLDEGAILYEYWRGKPLSELSEHVDWMTPEGHIPYKVMAIEHFNSVRDTILVDLTERFAGIRHASFGRAADAALATAPVRVDHVGFRRAFVDKLAEARSGSADAWTRLWFLNAALAGIAEHGGDQFRPLVRDGLAENSMFTRNAAIRALCKVADPSDMEALLHCATTEYGEEAAMAASAALRLTDDVVTVVRSLLQSSSSAIAKLGLRTLADRDPRVAVEICTELLRDDDENLRTIALAHLVPAMADERLRKLLAEYTSRSGYFYNVVCWLDRVLYAPEPLRARYRAQLLAHRDP